MFLVDAIVARIRHVCTKDDTSITVSICAGLGVTELQSSSLCLCLDKDKRSLQAGVMVKKFARRTSSRVVWDRFDYSQNLKDLLAAISKSLELEVIVLMQHPSPSSDGVSQLQKACQDITDCMEDGIVSTLCFVYDYCPNRNTWSRSSLLRMCIPDTLLDSSNKFGISSEVCISKKGNIKVDHPLFGHTFRYGWAKARNSDEMSFSIFLQ